jgi:hypothetical protein
VPASSPAWIFDSVPASGARSGGLAQAHIISPGIDAFVREVLQNSGDQRCQGAVSVRVRFRLEDLAGNELDTFLDAMHWAELAEHLESAANAKLPTISHRLRTSLQRLKERRLRLLLIEDSETNGLTGDEDETDSNFNALCRNILITSATRRQSGGSFGVGKSVLWNFSGLSTVMFSSEIRGDGRELVPRFFGSTRLPSHDTVGGSWDGSGWFGEPETTALGERARSILAGNARDIAEACRVARPESSGTSILVVGFAEPAEEGQRPVEDICTDIVSSTSRWFWPALGAGRLDVLVEGREDATTVFSKHAQLTDEIDPFAQAQGFSEEPVEILAEPGDVAEREIFLEVPAQNADTVADPRPAVKGRVLLRVRMAESGETDLPNSVALQRGTGMVVAYEAPLRRAPGDQTFQGVLLAGTAHGEADADQAVEEFLRASEPPEHNAWKGSTERVTAEYRAGARNALKAFFDDIAEAVREMTREPVGETEEGPELLRRLFPMPGIGVAPEPLPPYRLEDPDARLDGSRWTFSGRFVRHRATEGKWRFRVRLFVDQEGGGKLKAIPIGELSAPGAELRGPRPDGSWDIDAIPTVHEVKFSGATGELPDVPEGGAHEVGVQLEVRATEALAEVEE